METLDVSGNPCISEIATLLNTISDDFPNVRNLNLSNGKVDSLNQFLEVKDIKLENLARLDLSNTF